MIPWTEEDDIRLIKYIAYCKASELPSREELQRLIKKCFMLKEAKNGNSKTNAGNSWNS